MEITKITHVQYTGGPDEGHYEVQLSDPNACISIRNLGEVVSFRSFRVLCMRRLNIMLPPRSDRNWTNDINNCLRCMNVELRVPYEQLRIAFGKYIAGYRKEDPEWTEEDEHAFSMCL